MRRSTDGGASPDRRVGAAVRAALPMYDWREVGWAVDVLWSSIRRRLAGSGITVPHHLTRPVGVDDLWFQRSTVLDQVCSLNPVREGAGTVVPLGTLAYRPPPDLPTCAPGDYYSVIVCRAGDRRRHGDDLTAFAGARLAANGTDSQSGYWSLGHHVGRLLDGGPLFGCCDLTGSHRASIRAVAGGTADLAAIDVHSWRLARRHEPAAHGLVVVGATDPTPGVVCITSAAYVDGVDRIQAALAAAADEVAGTAAGHTLGLVGYRRRDPAEFDVVARRVAAAARTAWHA